MKTGNTLGNFLMMLLTQFTFVGILVIMCIVFAQMIDLLAAATLDLNEAWNLSWGEGIQFILVLAFLYWLKVQIDTRAGLGKKKRNELKRVIVEAITESGLADNNS